jgi:hypothetical protein
MALAARTVPVAAATIYQVVLGATLAAVNDGTEKVGAAAGDGIDGPSMLIGHRRAEALDILRTKVAHDLLNRCHYQILSSDC